MTTIRLEPRFGIDASARSPAGGVNILVKQMNKGAMRV